MDNRKDGGILLKRYLQIPIYIAISLIPINIFVLILNRKIGLIMSVFSLFAILILVGIYLTSSKNILKSMIEFAGSLENTMTGFVKEMNIPCCIIGPKGDIVWGNDSFMGINTENVSNIYAMFTDFDLLRAKSEENKSYYTYKDRRYRLEIKKADIYENDNCIIYFYDDTKRLETLEELSQIRPVTGLIYIDNYDEVMESVEEVRRSLLEALIDRKISQYISATEGIVRKFDKDKYFFIMQNKDLDKLEEERFDILEEVKNINLGNAISVTLSIGIGAGNNHYQQNYEYSRMAIDMALGRGGDQVVIKNQDSIRYFGGKSKAVEKTTRVKARVKAHTLREIMLSKDRVIIMGHKNMDIDVFGAAIGIWRTSVSLGKKAHIVTSDINSSLKPIVEKFKTAEYPEDLFILSDKAKALVDANTMLVVVDVNRPSITEMPELLEMIGTIVVLDHHRQSSEIIDNAVLSYVETYASSACEMVAEIVQYISDDIKLKPAEADAMYAGIVVDTLNFTNQTGVRTFEAAAFLKRKGADVTRVRKLFRERIENYRARAAIIHRAVVFEDCFAISDFDGEGVESPIVIGAKAANELLGVIGVKASIVVTAYKDTIYVSARSIDEINVQLIMEKLGGGGHRTVAGAQFKEKTIDEVIDMIKRTIKEMLEKGEI